MRRAVDYAIYFLAALAIVSGIAIVATVVGDFLVGGKVTTLIWDDVDWHLTFCWFSLLESFLLFVFFAWYPTWNLESTGWLSRLSRNNLGFLTLGVFVLPCLGLLLHGAVPLCLTHHLLLLVVIWAIYEHNAPILQHVVRPTRSASRSQPQPQAETFEHLNQLNERLAHEPAAPLPQLVSPPAPLKPLKIVRRRRRILDLQAIAARAKEAAEYWKAQRKLEREAKKKQPKKETKRKKK